MISVLAKIKKLSNDILTEFMSYIADVQASLEIPIRIMLVVSVIYKTVQKYGPNFKPS